MTARRSTLLVCTVALGAMALGACQKPPRSVPNTFDSPRDVAFVRWCETVDGDTLNITRHSDDCLGAESAYAMVANTGDRFVHVVRADLASLRFVDYDPSIPGNTGIVVPSGPSQIEPLSHPTMAVVTSSVEPALSVVELRSGTRVSLDSNGTDLGNSVRLDEPVGALRVIPADTGSIAVATLPLSRRLVTWTIEAQCGESADTWSTGCEPSATLTAGVELGLPGSPNGVAVRDDGRAFVSMRDDRRIFVFGVAGDALAECGGSPCQLAAMPTTWSCSDGIDDDGDGLTDAEDPQCFSETGDEAGLALADGTLTACTDGVDNDGNGVLDADDPGCLDAGDRVEGDGYDGALSITALGTTLDGVPVLTVPSQDAVAPPIATRPAPACSDGEDNDGDGAIDWPDDADCFGPYSDTEAVALQPVVPSLALTEEGDLLIAAERQAGQVLFYDADTLELVRQVNDLDGLHDTYGTRLLTSFIGPVATDTATLYANVSGDFGDSEIIQLVERRAHVATTSGFADTIIIDREWTTWTGDPALSTSTLVEGPYVVDIFEPYDATARRGTLDRVDCTIPPSVSAFAPTPARCDEETLPQPVPIRPLTDTCGEPVELGDEPYNEQPAAAFALFPESVRVQLGSDDDCDPPNTAALVADPVSDDYAIQTVDWEYVYQGPLNGATRDDALVASGSGEARGWLAFAGDEPCASATPNFCSTGVVDADDCPTLASLCSEGSAAVCALDIDVCDLCPSACSDAVDMCAAGVLPGDIVEVERFDEQDAAGHCVDFVELPNGENPADFPALEYVVCSVAEGHIEVATFADGCGTPLEAPYTTIDSLPPSDCGVPLEVVVRSRDWHIQRDTQVGPSPYHAVDGLCVFHEDAENRVLRAPPGTRFTSPFGVTFEVAPALEPTVVDGVEVYPREFQIVFDVTGNFSYRTSSLRQLLLGPATSALVVGDTDRGRRIFAVDESQSIMWIYSSDSYVEPNGADPLP